MTRDARGFTLLELMVSLSFVAVAVLAVLPNLREMMARNRVTSAARSIQTTLQTARMRAINERRDYVVLFENAGWNLFQDADRDGVKDSAEPWIQAAPAPLPAQVRFMMPPVTNGGNPSDVPQLPTSGCRCARYQSNGTVVVTGDTSTLAIALGDKKYYRQLQLTVGGAVKMQQWNARLAQWQ